MQIPKVFTLHTQYPINYNVDAFFKPTTYPLWIFVNSTKPTTLFMLAILHQFDLWTLVHNINKLESKKETKDMTVDIPTK
jgi:hypothetical protein